MITREVLPGAIADRLEADGVRVQQAANRSGGRDGAFRFEDGVEVPYTFEDSRQRVTLRIGNRGRDECDRFIGDPHQGWKDERLPGMAAAVVARAEKMREGRRKAAQEREVAEASYAAIERLATLLGGSAYGLRPSTVPGRVRVTIEEHLVPEQALVLLAAAHVAGLAEAGTFRPPMPAQLAGVLERAEAAMGAEDAGRAAAILAVVVRHLGPLADGGRDAGEQS